MLAACPCFESGETEWTEPGTNRHKLFAAMINIKVVGTPIPDYAPGDFSADDVEACKWATDFFMFQADWKNKPVVSEQKMSVVLPDFTEIEGTPDVSCGHDLFDLKSRPRDYRPQMAVYALMLMERNPQLEFINVHLLFTATQTREDYTLTWHAALAIVTEVIGNTRPQDGSEPKPRSCDYCGWCAKRATCPAITDRAKEVATGYRDKAPEINISDWHPSQMETAEQIALGLTIARKLLSKWCESMEFHALEAVVKKGLKLPGYELAETAPRRFCSDVSRAFSLAGLPQEKFMACCDLRLNTSKKYPDRAGLTDIYREHFKIEKKAHAKKELDAKLADVMRHGTSKPKLKAIGGDDADEAD